MRRDATEVAIIGGGPAGLLLGHLLHRAGVDTVILERRPRAHVLARIRAGVLEPSAVDFLRREGPPTRIDSLGRPLDTVHFAWQGSAGLALDIRRWTGQCMTAYGQTFLTEDLYAARDATGVPVVDEVEDVAICDVEGGAPFVTYRRAGVAHRLECRAVAGCDGAQGVAAKTIPAAVSKTFERAFPFAWVGIMVERPPINALTYIRHSEGFALASQRTPMLSRYYVQAPLSDRIEDWPDTRFWETFVRRAPAEVVDRLQMGPSIEKSISPLRSRVIEPLRWGRLFLAGDAGHIVPPTGAKGLNLAISDVQRLSRALISWLREASTVLIDSYSQDALRRIWAAESLSWRLTKFLHAFPDETAFDERIRLAEFDLLLHCETARAALAYEYAGLPFSQIETRRISDCP
ncbi:4-hydroxybenzoate 3-monooxygenase [Phaeovulum sp.]|jgi:p-hydroxybenzoate 3-monooxygenase|uniref:4-hydroxybenzoate 3-monooxygenase n=1 Tax=Phaeovulum sp. TaxID=2934796 RepID=UPI00272FC8A4|nr:4-hydroxybenzoate 3-monooxygenase [Phaeovulum sp.]MDP1670274.1 4-hydroxybenzoate 3-monooxygenase [Phaeovulum sp.]MDZ4118038.1 4-hydroxybenzoate 3-monooxygenase [Phaeovulum sp.]